jgi:hypothetical protein
MHELYEESSIDVVRLIAFVHSIEGDPEDPSEMKELIKKIKSEPGDEYMIDYLSKQDLALTDEDAILSKAIKRLTELKIIEPDGKSPKMITWKLLKNGELTPTEKSLSELDRTLGVTTKYKVTDLRVLH